MVLVKCIFKNDPNLKNSFCNPLTDNNYSVCAFCELLGKIYRKWFVYGVMKKFDKPWHQVCFAVYSCVDTEKSAWNHFNAIKFLRFVGKNKWLKNMLARALENIQDGTQEGEVQKTLGDVIPKVRIDKPWGWELILTTVREGDEQGYAEKYLIIVGPLSNQLHRDYEDHGEKRSAKVETQTSYGPSPYLLRIGGGTENEEFYKVLPGGIFHIAANHYHQPSVKRGDVVIVKETSKPNIGPGSTTRDPNGDPWKSFRSRTDI